MASEKGGWSGIDPEVFTEVKSYSQLETGDWFFAFGYGFSQKIPHCEWQFRGGVEIANCVSDDGRLRYIPLAEDVYPFEWEWCDPSDPPDPAP